VASKAKLLRGTRSSVLIIREMNKDRKHLDKEKDSMVLLLLGVSSIFLIVLFFVFGPDDGLNFGSLTARKSSQESLAAEQATAEKKREGEVFRAKLDEIKRNTEQTAKNADFGKSPVKKGNIEIQYVEAEKTYKIRIDTNNIDEFRKLKPEAENMLKQAGVSDLCSIKANYIIPVKIKGSTTWEDLFITGCAPSNS